MQQCTGVLTFVNEGVQQIISGVKQATSVVEGSTASTELGVFEVKNVTSEVPVTESEKPLSLHLVQHGRAPSGQFLGSGRHLGSAAHGLGQTGQFPTGGFQRNFQQHPLGGLLKFAQICCFNATCHIARTRSICYANFVFLYIRLCHTKIRGFCDWISLFNQRNKKSGLFPARGDWHFGPVA